VKLVPKRPESMPNAPMNMKWLLRRFISVRMTRMYSARSGTWMSIRRSTARQ
jgi:hypothetical protein